jgi:hypothetical protein
MPENPQPKAKTDLSKIGGQNLLRINEMGSDVSYSVQDSQEGKIEITAHFWRYYPDTLELSANGKNLDDALSKLVKFYRNRADKYK